LSKASNTALSIIALPLLDIIVVAASVVVECSSPICKTQIERLVPKSRNVSSTVSVLVSIRCNGIVWLNGRKKIGGTLKRCAGCTIVTVCYAHQWSKRMDNTREAAMEISAHCSIRAFAITCENE
jgi:hypothetical protein